MEVQRPVRELFVNGRVAPMSKSNVHQVFDPATQETSGYVAMGNRMDVERTVVAARRAFAGFSVTSPCR